MRAMKLLETKQEKEKAIMSKLRRKGEEEEKLRYI